MSDEGHKVYSSRTNFQRKRSSWCLQKNTVDAFFKQVPTHSHGGSTFPTRRKQ